MSNTDFENEQEMAVEDKTYPSLGPTEDSQNMEARAVNLVPMPAFTDPHNPAALSGSVNLPLDKHPVTHSEDFGDVPTIQERGEESVASAMVGDASDLAGDTSEELDLPEDRDAWNKSHWQKQANALGLPTSGNVAAVRERVEEHEKSLEDAKSLSAEDWKGQIEDAEDADELAELRQLYQASGSDYATIQSAFEGREQELANPAPDASDAAAALAEEKDIDLNTIEGSGSGGTITKGDVEAAIKARDGS